MLNPCKQFRSYSWSKQSGFFSVLYVRYVFRHRKLVYQILNVNKSPPFSDLNQRLNINISVFFLYICVFSFPCPYSCIFFLLFLSLSLCRFSLFFVLCPICYFSPLECLSWVCSSLYLKACFTLFTPLYSPPRLCFLSRI